LILFPYANNLEYRDGRLSFAIQFINDEKTVEIAMNIELDEDLSTKIEELLETV
jgi:hypothetical protein